MTLTEIAIKRPAFMTMIFTALIVLGIYGYSNMGVDLLPKMDFPMVFVSIIYPGAGPREVETEISKPVEEALSSINGIKTLRSFSNENVSFSLIEFTMSTDPNVALNDVERKINEIKMNLPKDILQPQIVKNDMQALPIIRTAITADMEPVTLFQYIKDKIKPRIEQVSGISGVTIVGGREREIRVEIDNSRLKASNLTIQQVTQLIGASNLDIPTGKIKQEKQNYIVRLEGKFKNLDALKNTVLASTPTGTIKLKDLAEVYDTYKEDFTISRLNGEQGIGLIIQKASDANAIETSNQINKMMKKLEEENINTKLKFTISQDLTQFTRNSVNDVMFDLGLAILLVAIVLFFFLHNIKNSLIVILSIPTSMLSAFIMMYIFGFTINLITLMALTLVIGILVDDSIVVLENIHRHVEKGEDSKTAAINGRNEIGMAAIAITLVDVVVFLPIAMLSGMVGKIFREFGITVVVSTLFSLFVSFTLTPLLASKWAKLVHYSKTSLMSRFIEKFNDTEKKAASLYKRILSWSLGHRKTILMISLSLLLIGLSFIPLGLVGTEFMPNLDRGEFALNIEMPQGTSIEETDKAAIQIENFIKASPEVERYYAVIGRNEGAWGDNNRSYYSQLQIKLVNKNERRKTNDVIDDFLKKSHNIPGVKATASLIGLFGTAEESAIWIEIRGIDLDSIIPVSEKVLGIVEKTRSTRDVKTSWEEGQPELKVVIDRDKCATFNITMGEVAMAMRNSYEGDITSKYKEADTQYDIRILLAKKDRSNPENLGNVTLINRFGQQFKLSDVATVFIGKGPSQIQRKERSKLISIMANIDGSRPLSEVINDINKETDKIKLAQGVSIHFSGQTEDMGNMFRDMLLAIGFAILFMYMIMVSLYESYIYPFIIMFSLPVALFGAMMGLMLTNLNMNMFSMIGILLSMGLVAKNGILLVDYTNTLRARGLSVKEALLESGATRLRPILMTTFTMVFGMLPLLMAKGGAGDMRRGIAAVVIGALISSTMLTLALVPVVYTIVDGWKDRFPRLFKKLSFSRKKVESNT